MSGYFQMARGWMAAFPDGPFSERESWIWLIENAAWKPTHQRNAKGERIEVQRGQFRTSLRSLGEVWGWGKNKVSRYLQDLEDREMIGTVAGQSGMLITICNYNKYQTPQDSQAPKRGTVSGQSRDTKEEGKEGKEENTPLSPLPEWVPVETWGDFVAMRRSIKKPLTAVAQKRLIAELAKLKASGNQPEKVLDQSIVNSWAGVFKLKTNGRAMDADGEFMGPC